MNNETKLVWCQAQIGLLNARVAAMQARNQWITQRGMEIQDSGYDEGHFFNVEEEFSKVIEMLDTIEPKV